MVVMVVVITEGSHKNIGSCTEYTLLLCTILTVTMLYFKIYTSSIYSVPPSMQAEAELRTEMVGESAQASAIEAHLGLKVFWGVQILFGSCHLYWLRSENERCV